MKASITVVTPTIPPRATLLKRAVMSVGGQTLRPSGGVIVTLDDDRRGAAATRHEGLMEVDTVWTAFLDDDDEFMPQHLERLYAEASLTGADYVYSYYMVKDAFGRERPDIDPIQHFGEVFDNANPIQTTITMLVKTELAQSIGFNSPPEGAVIDGQVYGEDYGFTVACAKAGAKIIHLPERTWFWWHHGLNTSGRSDRW